VLQTSLPLNREAWSSSGIVAPQLAHNFALEASSRGVRTKRLPHFGHLAFFPFCSSATLNLAWQLGHCVFITVFFQRLQAFALLYAELGENPGSFWTEGFSEAGGAGNHA
jgi:hypothetical protein